MNTNCTALHAEITAILREKYADLVEYGKAHEGWQLLANKESDKLGRFAVGYDIGAFTLKAASEHFVNGALFRKPKGVLLGTLECNPGGGNKVHATIYIWEPELPVPTSAVTL